MPSVMLPKFRSSIGSSKRGLVEPLTCADMVEIFEEPRVRRKNVVAKQFESCSKEGIVSAS